MRHRLEFARNARYPGARARGAGARRRGGRISPATAAVDVGARGAAPSVERARAATGGIGRDATAIGIARTGTHADVDVQSEFNRDIRAAAAKALATTQPGETLNPADGGNPWAGYDDYIDRVAIQCDNAITPEWSRKLAAFDVYVWDQCYAMEQSLRID